MAMADAIDVLERVGALALGGYRSRWPGADNLGVGRHRLLAKGYAALAAGVLPDVFDRVFEGFRARVGGSPGLTTAYGWCYHWLNSKGDKRFSPGLSRLVLEHAVTPFVVDKRARAKVLPPTSTCTLKEATARCGVTILVMRDILEQRGLLSRAKVRGLAFRIPEAEIRAIEMVMRDSIDANGAAALLGTRWKVVKDLTALGILKPWVAGGRATKHAYVFRRAEVQAVLDRLAAGYRSACASRATRPRSRPPRTATSSPRRSCAARRWRGGWACGQDGDRRRAAGAGRAARRGSCDKEAPAITNDGGRCIAASRGGCASHA